LTFELLQRQLSMERQKALPVTHRGQTLDCGYRLDLLVEGGVIVEVNAIEHVERASQVAAAIVLAAVAM
jgi:GxxExxY protein